ncbi:MAG: hypothetical protein ABL907_02175 [Hyphomicrobium sp.]
MPPFLDFSSAFPWFVSGLLAGLFLYWLVRMLIGTDRRRRAELQSARAELDEARRAQTALAEHRSQIEAERARLTSEINQLSPRASLVPQLERQLAGMKEVDAKRAGEIEAANQQLAALRESTAAEIATLRQNAEGYSSNAKYYETEYGRLHAAHQALNTEWSSSSNMLTKLQSDYAVASREAGEATRLRSELASAKAEIDAARAEIVSHKSAEAMLKQEIERLTLDYTAKLKAADTHLAEYTSDLSRLKTQLAAAPKVDHSGEVQRLTGELNRLRDIEARNESLSNEVSRLKAEAAIAPKVDLSGEVQRLNAELVKVQSDLAAAPKFDLIGEVDRLNGDVTRLTATLNSVRAEERTAAMDLHATRNDLSQVRMGMEEMSRLLSERNGEVEQLKLKLAAMPDVENYRRFKEALEAANRIASGLPEKA